MIATKSTPLSWQRFGLVSEVKEAMDSDQTLSAVGDETAKLAAVWHFIAASTRDPIAHEATRAKAAILEARHGGPGAEEAGHAQARARRDARRGRR